MSKLTKEIKARIDAMSRTEMARKWRFTDCGDPLFQREAGAYFKKRFDELGGFSVQISKEIGWDG